MLLAACAAISDTRASNLAGMARAAWPWRHHHDPESARRGAPPYGPEDTGIGRTWGSPILAEGKIYVTGETAETAVIQAGPAYKLIAKNRLDGTYTLSTPAFADGEIFLRTATHLYCISK